MSLTLTQPNFTSQQFKDFDDLQHDYSWSEICDH